MGKLGSFVLVVSLVACSSKSTKKPDAPVIDDAPIDARSCGATITAPAPSFQVYDTQAPAVYWHVQIPGGLEGNDLFLQYEFYGNIETSLVGTFDLTAGNQSNYKTCAICVHAFEQDSTGTAVKDFFQSAG